MERYADGQQAGQGAGEHAVLRVLVRQPGVGHRLVHLRQRRGLRRRVEERADLVVALQSGPHVLHLDLVHAGGGAVATIGILA